MFTAINAFRLCKGSLCISSQASRSLYVGSIQFSPLQQQFEEAKTRLNSLSEDPGNETKLKLYGLFKQATEGPVKSQRPGFTDFVGRAKWDAWNSIGDITQEAARQKYIDLINSLVKSEEKDLSSRQESGQKYNTLLIEIDGGLRKIILNRPKQLNATNFEMFREWADALREADKDPKTVLTAVTGAGSYFSAGNDIVNNFGKLGPNETAKLEDENLKALHGIVTTLIDFRKPLVAVVNGPAIGIGLTILPHFDGVYSTDKAIFSCPFTAVGLVPEACSSETFPRLMGYSNAAQLLLFNKKIGAEEARRLGLVTEVFPDDTFQSEIWSRLKQFSKLPPNCLYYSKDLMREGDREYLHKVSTTEWTRIKERWESEDCAKFVRKFQSKKK